MLTSQEFSSANTSINKTKLPAIYGKIDFDLYQYSTILDVGCGKYTDHIKEYLKNFNVCYRGYDRYNKPMRNNIFALRCKPSLIVCSNVLNVIKEESIIKGIIELIEGYQVPFKISVYEGNKTGIGSTTKKDCYQRNERIGSYLKYFTKKVIIKKGIIEGY